MKLLLVVSAMIGSYCACAQDSHGVQYVVNNKKMRNTGWLLAGGGTTLIAGGVILLSGKDRSNRGLKQAVGGGMVAAGAISVGTSIPMFAIGSQSNGVKFSLKKEKFLSPVTMGAPVTMGYRLRSRPAVAVHINL